MIHIINKQNCCGCGACAQACSLGCITMTEDLEGFLYPKVDASRCVSCGACTRACPMHSTMDTPQHTRVYAAYSTDAEMRRTSSSGGVFSLLAEQVLSEGGAVFGAAFDDDWSVHHVMAECTDELQPLKGSKYLQSRMENTYRRLEAILQDGRPVLFTGTGCQVAGLKTYLKKEYDLLYTVDVFCHGVPSPKVWQRYLQEQESAHQGEVCKVSFRHKEPGWRDYSLRLSFANGREYCAVHDTDAYIKLFLSEICLRPSCHGCQFRKSRSGADLTIGDAWGVEQWMPHMDDNKGTSVVVVNSEKGGRLWSEIQGRLCSEEGNPTELLSCNPVYYHSVKQHPNRERFFKALSADAPMEELMALCRKPLWRRVLSFAKRCVKKMLKICGIRILQ